MVPMPYLFSVGLKENLKTVVTLFIAPNNSKGSWRFSLKPILGTSGQKRDG